MKYNQNIIPFGGGPNIHILGTHTKYFFEGESNMNFKKIIITIVSICILIYLASHIRYEYLDYTSHVLTKEQEDILYSSTLDLTQENLLESGFWYD